VEQYDLDTGETIKTFPSQAAAHKATGVMQQSISQCIHKRSSSAGGYGWRRAGSGGVAGGAAAAAAADATGGIDDYDVGGEDEEDGEGEDEGEDGDGVFTTAQMVQRRTVTTVITVITTTMATRKTRKRRKWRKRRRMPSPSLLLPLTFCAAHCRRPRHPRRLRPLLLPG
jgi:hypothetical protein